MSASWVFSHLSARTVPQRRSSKDCVISVATGGHLDVRFSPRRDRLPGTVLFEFHVALEAANPQKHGGLAPYPQTHGVKALFGLGGRRAVGRHQCVSVYREKSETVSEMIRDLTVSFYGKIVVWSCCYR